MQKCFPPNWIEKSAVWFEKKSYILYFTNLKKKIIRLMASSVNKLLVLKLLNVILCHMSQVSSSYLLQLMSIKVNPSHIATEISKCFLRWRHFGFCFTFISNSHFYQTEGHQAISLNLGKSKLSQRALHWSREWWGFGWEEEAIGEYFYPKLGVQMWRMRDWEDEGMRGEGITKKWKLPIFLIAFLWPIRYVQTCILHCASFCLSVLALSSQSPESSFMMCRNNDLFFSRCDSNSGNVQLAFLAPDETKLRASMRLRCQHQKRNEIHRKLAAHDFMALLKNMTRSFCWLDVTLAWRARMCVNFDATIMPRFVLEGICSK